MQPSKEQCSKIAVVRVKIILKYFPIASYVKFVFCWLPFLISSPDKNKKNCTAPINDYSWIQSKFLVSEIFLSFQDKVLHICTVIQKLIILDFWLTQTKNTYILNRAIQGIQQPRMLSSKKKKKKPTMYHFHHTGDFKAQLAKQSSGIFSLVRQI